MALPRLAGAVAWPRSFSRRQASRIRSCLGMGSVHRRRIADVHAEAPPPDRGVGPTGAQEARARGRTQTKQASQTGSRALLPRTRSRRRSRLLLLRDEEQSVATRRQPPRYRDGRQATALSRSAASSETCGFATSFARRSKSEIRVVPSLLRAAFDPVSPTSQEPVLRVTTRLSLRVGAAVSCRTLRSTAATDAKSAAHGG